MTGDSVIDISHECLIRRWKALGKWAEEEADWGEWYRRVEDRRRIKGALLVDPELEAALLAREHGRWNPAWAERYATEKGGEKLAYDEVNRFLDDSRKKRTNVVWRIAALEAVFALLAVVAGVALWFARQANIRADMATAQYATLLTISVTRGPEIAGAGGKYILIRAGTFLMGCSLGDTDCDADEKPTHKVTLTRDFYMGETDVTVGAFRRFAMETHRTPPTVPSFPQTADHPVVNVSWQDAVDYCKWDDSGRLPTEAQWEYAARAGTSQSRYGNLDEIAWYDENSGNGTHPVKQKQPNNFGLYDMLGNVWQWTADRYDAKYYEKSPAENPPGPGSSPEGGRSVRGGSWVIKPRYLRVSDRVRSLPGDRFNNVGFRCVREVP